MNQLNYITKTTAREPARFLVAQYFRHVIAIGAVALLFAGLNPVSAQITSGFELDGNAIAVTPNPPDDWSLIYAGTGNAQVTTGIVSDLPHGADNAFKIGASDLDDVSSWHWAVFNTPDKDELCNGGAALYNNSQVYFFGNRFAVNGAAEVGFWFFKKKVATNPDGTFSGTHSVGDILLLSDFENGGGVSVVSAYQWVGSGGDHGSLNSVPVLGINLYAITNSTTATAPWPYLSKTGSTNFEPGAFFEGGINLAGLGITIDACFSSFLLETRSSHTINAELKDFILGGFYTEPQVVLNSTAICNGGSVTLAPSVSGGVLPLTYAWSNGATTSSITVSPSATTSYSVTVTGANGCASILNTATVTVNPNYNTSQSVQTCANVPYSLPWGGTGVAGANTHLYTAANGCDSSVTINLTFVPTYNTSQSASTCNNQPYNLPWGGTGVAGANTHIYTAGNGCDSTVTINLTIHPTYNTSQSATTCDNQPYNLPWGGTGSSGANTHLYQSINGCDSSVTINLTVYPTYNTSQSATTCDNQPYNLPWGGTGSGGANTHLYQTINGCDSNVTINLTIYPTYNVSQSAFTCDNQPYSLPWGGTGVSGANSHLYQTVNGCDSSVTINLTVYATYNTIQNAFTCDNQPYTLPWGGIGSSGANTHLYQSVNACDSNVTINLTVYPTYNTNQSAFTCDNQPYSLPWGGTGVSGANSHLYQSVNGCDSMATINLTVYPTYNTSQSATTCDNIPYTLPWGGTGVAGANTHLYQSVNGCDSNVTINLTVNLTYNTSQSAFTCDNQPYNLPWGGIGVPGANSHLYQSIHGCDSTATINLTIYPTYSTSQSASTCDNQPYNLPWGGAGSAGANSHLYQSINGCDSLATINLTVYPTYNTSQSAFTCDNQPYSLPWGGTGSAGANTHLYQTINGCDSMVTINLTVYPTYNVSQSAFTCDNQPYSLPWGETGVAGANSHLYQSINGCDSTVTINLTVYPTYNTSQSAFTCDNQPYNLPWGGTGIAGANTHLYQSVNGCDSSATINLTVYATYDIQQSASTCSNSPYPLPWGGYGVAGANSHLYQTVNGCDSMLTINLTISPNPVCTIVPPSSDPFCGSTGNLISADVTSGTAPFTYSWSVTGSGWIITYGSDSSVATYTAGSSVPGVFTVNVTDANGCTSSCTLSVNCSSPYAGCTIGFWKNHVDIWRFSNLAIPQCVTSAISSMGVPYSGNGTSVSSFANTFGVSGAQMTAAGLSPSLTLVGALNLGGGGFEKLARQGVASLLNSCSFSSFFPYTTTQILGDINNAIIALTPEPLASQYGSANETLPEMCPAAGPASTRPEGIIIDGLIINVYPNPFDTYTGIQFSSPFADAHVAVEVYSVTGSLVASLFEGNIKAGITYKADFYAGDLVSGIYFYRIICNSEKVVQGKMILIK